MSVAVTLALGTDAPEGSPIVPVIAGGTDALGMDTGANNIAAANKTNKTNVFADRSIGIQPLCALRDLLPGSATILSDLADKRHYLVSYRLLTINRGGARSKDKDPGVMAGSA